jgi:hypothetical protein
MAEETPPETPPENPPATARSFDEAYQTEVRDKLKGLSEELESVEGTASVRRSLAEALRFLPA